MQRYIDSHCHLSDSFDTMFARAGGAGITGCVLNSVDMSDWNKITQIAKHNKNVIGCIGIHPWRAGNISANCWDTMRAILRDNPKLIVGEIGLDKTRDDFELQKHIFAQQIDIATEYNRTINIHCVHAWDTVSHILKSYGKQLPKVVLHSFDGTENAIDFDADLYFSYSPNVANNKYKKVISSLARVPKNKILVESDSDDLTKTKIAANGVIARCQNITTDDIFNNSTKAFFNG